MAEQSQVSQEEILKIANSSFQRQRDTANNRIVDLEVAYTVKERELEDLHTQYIDKIVALETTIANQQLELDGLRKHDFDAVVIDVPKHTKKK